MKDDVNDVYDSMMKEVGAFYNPTDVQMHDRFEKENLTRNLVGTFLQEVSVFSSGTQKP